jgi:alpha-methylacyl-CoA racemase
MCAMLLADLGAEVLRIDRVGDSDLGVPIATRFSLLNRGRRSVAVDLGTPDGVEVVLRLAERSDALIEGFRPGVAERLGIGPETCLARNERLVYGRMTGWGQSGPLAAVAGHDTNYIALTGALHAIGRRGETPVLPLNLVGDFGGGALYLAMGVLAALHEAGRSGRGQVVDAAMVDGAASLMTLFYGLHAAGMWSDARGENLLDTGAPYIEVYETKDGRFVSVCALERKFYVELVRRMGADPDALPDRNDRSAWPALKKWFADTFRSRTRDAWCGLLEGTDACFAPVLGLAEAPSHPHMKARGTFATVDGVVQPAPAPRFSRTPGEISRPPARPGEHTEEALRDFGFRAEELAELRQRGAIR